MERLRTVHEQQIWANRPDYATEARLKALERMDVWSDVMDHGVAFQRAAGTQEEGSVDRSHEREEIQAALGVGCAEGQH
jgi:hypothetical protein